MLRMSWAGMYDQLTLSIAATATGWNRYYQVQH